MLRLSVSVILVGPSEAGLRVYPLRMFEVVEPFGPAGGRPLSSCEVVCVNGAG